MSNTPDTPDTPDTPNTQEKTFTVREFLAAVCDETLNITITPIKSYYRSTKKGKEDFPYQSLIMQGSIVLEDSPLVAKLHAIYGGHIYRKNQKKGYVRYILSSNALLKFLNEVIPLLDNKVLYVTEALTIWRQWKGRELGDNPQTYADLWKGTRVKQRISFLDQALTSLGVALPSKDASASPKAILEDAASTPPEDFEGVEMTIDEFYHKVYKTRETDKYDEQVELFYQAHGRYHDTEEELNEWLVANKEISEESEEVSEDDNESPNESPNEDWP